MKELKEKSLELARRINKKPDLIIYVARAGYLIANEISEALQLPIIGVAAERKGNGLKSKFVGFLSILPKNIKTVLRNIEVKSNIHNQNTERNVSWLESTSQYIGKVKSVLIIDDAVDTGNSLLSVKKKVIETFGDIQIRFAAINVMSNSKKNIDIDYYLYNDVLLMTPMSKDSKEYKLFLEMYNNRERALYNG